MDGCVDYATRAGMTSSLKAWANDFFHTTAKYEPQARKGPKVPLSYQRVGFMSTGNFGWLRADDCAILSLFTLCLTTSHLKNTNLHSGEPTPFVILNEVKNLSHRVQC